MFKYLLVEFEVDITVGITLPVEETVAVAVDRVVVVPSRIIRLIKHSNNALYFAGLV